MADAKKPTTLALDGFDPVTYFENGKPRVGKFEFKILHDGLTYCFTNTTNLEKFTRSPKDYVPQFGGTCAFATAIGGSSPGSPKAWKIVNGKLYLSANPIIGKIWSLFPALIDRGHSKYLAKTRRR